MSPDQMMDLIVSHAVTLGLRFPMEPTVQKIVGLYCMMSNGYNQAMSLAGSMKLEFVKFAKKRVKALGISPPTSLVPKLPVDPVIFSGHTRRCIRRCSSTGLPLHARWTWGS